MKIQMRPTSTQFIAPVRFTTPGTYEIDLTKYLLAGCTQVYSLCVGGAGGASDDFSQMYNGRTYQAKAAGGGGGGSRYRVHNLSSLVGDLSRTVTVGAAGVKGGSGGNGTAGGVSSFDTLNSAPGGLGGVQGSLSTGISLILFSAHGGQGGNPLSAATTNPGDPGDGGWNGRTSDTDPGVNPHSPTAGTWVTSGLTLPDLGIGIGGGGGSGTHSSPYDPQVTRAAQNGTSGAGTTGDQYSPGALAASSVGGGGGGAREKFLTGLDQHYGTHNPAANCKSTGAVILKFV